MSAFKRIFTEDFWNLLTVSPFTDKNNILKTIVTRELCKNAGTEKVTENSVKAVTVAELIRFYGTYIQFIFHLCQVLLYILKIHMVMTLQFSENILNKLDRNLVSSKDLVEIDLKQSELHSILLQMKSNNFFCIW